MNAPPDPANLVWRGMRGAEHVAIVKWPVKWPGGRAAMFWVSVANEWKLAQSSHVVAAIFNTWATYLLGVIEEVHGQLQEPYDGTWSDNPEDHVSAARRTLDGAMVKT